MVEENALHAGCRLMRVNTGCKVLKWLWSLHLISMGIGLGQGNWPGIQFILYKASLQ